MERDPTTAVRLKKLAAVNREIGSEAARLSGLAKILADVFDSSCETIEDGEWPTKLDEGEVLRGMIELFEERVKTLSDLEDKRDAVNEIGRPGKDEGGMTDDTLEPETPEEDEKELKLRLFKTVTQCTALAYALRLAISGAVECEDEEKRIANYDGLTLLQLENLATTLCERLGRDERAILDYLY